MTKCPHKSNTRLMGASRNCMAPSFMGEVEAEPSVRAQQPLRNALLHISQWRYMILSPRQRYAVAEGPCRRLSAAQHPLPSMLHAAPSADGRDCSPASSGVSVTLPSSSTKHGMPTAPAFLTGSKTALLSRSFKNALRAFTCLPMSIISYRSSPITCRST